MPTLCHFPKQNARRCADVALFPCPTAGAATPLLFPFPFSAFPCARRSSAPRWPSSVSPCPHDNVLVLRPRPPLSLRVVVVAPPPAHPRVRPEECRTAATVHQAADTEQQRQTQRQNQRSRPQQDICRDRRAIRHAICRTAATVHHLTTALCSGPPGMTCKNLGQWQGVSLPFEMWRFCSHIALAKQRASTANILRSYSRSRQPCAKPM